MEDVPEIKPVDLTPEEIELCKQMEAEFSKSSGYTGEAASRLMKSLGERKAIPKARIRYFTEPSPGGRGKSYQDDVKSGNYPNMFKSPHFVKYLRYFISGPALPPATIEGFRKILIEDLGTTGGIMDQLCTFVRAEVRKLRLDRTTARDEFWKLAQEVEYFHAETIRNAAGAAGK
ncbi:MAG TPA: hypothetical protein VJW20_03050 [Candidatus Angelobacter sp.]|nr:hypothetical protein [Candidatus Angelobacter sp.]